MLPITPQLLDELVSSHTPPCLSLYQPTHRRHPENLQDPIRFHNLLKELEASLLQEHPAAEVRLLLAPFEALASDGDFWRHTLEGLAVFGAKGIFRALRFPQTVSQAVVVANSFHTKPLRRFLQSVDRYQVLALSLDKIRLFEGNRHGLDAVALALGVPRTITEALGPDHAKPHQAVAAFGGVKGATTPIHHGHGDNEDEGHADAQRFFRVVDRAIDEQHSRPSGLPLILAALPEHHHLFHQVSQNPLLAVDGILGNPDAMSMGDLRALAWRVVEPGYHAKLARLGEQFNQASAKGLGSDDPADVAKAAASGQVATLLLESERQLGGHLDDATGDIRLASLDDPGVGDVLDALGELVVKMGGQTLVIPAAQMPSHAGLAAIYRY